jgi:hypothetical protein
MNVVLIGLYVRVYYSPIPIYNNAVPVIWVLPGLDNGPCLSG